MPLALAEGVCGVRSGSVASSWGSGLAGIAGTVSGAAAIIVAGVVVVGVVDVICRAIVTGVVTAVTTAASTPLTASSAAASITNRASLGVSGVIGVIDAANFCGLGVSAVSAGVLLELLGPGLLLVLCVVAPVGLSSGLGFFSEYGVVFPVIRMVTELGEAVASWQYFSLRVSDPELTVLPEPGMP